MAKEDHYKDKYGSWAGNPSGIKPDYSRCCESVMPNERGAISRQCGRKAGFGPDGAYCKQHDPDTVKARRAAEDARWREERKRERPKWFARKMFDALKEIANGHNDPRSLAAGIVAEIERD